MTLATVLMQAAHQKVSVTEFDGLVN